MIPRTIENLITWAGKHFPVVLVTGPRQVGKTTILKEIAKKQNLKIVTLDGINDRNLAQKEPEMFLQKYQGPVIIDEVQYAPDLFSYIKIHVDKEQKNGMYFLTGSQKFHLMKGVKESLAGRVAILNLLGFSMAELRGKHDNTTPFLPVKSWIDDAAKHSKSLNLPQVYSQMWTGFFPRINVDKDINPSFFYDTYLQSYIGKDVKEILQISDEMVFLKYLSVLAARTGQLLNLSDVAKDVGISSHTANSWLSILKTSGLVYLLQPYFNNLTKRAIKTPKLYFLDTGLCAFLTRWNSAESLETGAMSGEMFETFALTEILKSYWFNGKNPNFYFYRDTNQKEIDLVIEQDETLFPVEFKKTAMPDKKMVKHFSVLETTGKKIGTGAIVCLVQEDLPITKDVFAIPAGYL